MVAVSVLVSIRSVLRSLWFVVYSFILRIPCARSRALLTCSLPACSLCEGEVARGRFEDRITRSTDQITPLPDPCYLSHLCKVVHRSMHYLSDIRRLPLELLSARARHLYTASLPTDSPNLSSPDIHMSPPNALKKLRNLDRASPRFYKHLSSFIRSKEYRSTVPSLQGEDVAWLVEYLDSVSPKLFLSSPHPTLT